MFMDNAEGSDMHHSRCGSESGWNIYGKIWGEQTNQGELIGCDWFSWSQRWSEEM